MRLRVKANKKNELVRNKQKAWYMAHAEKPYQERIIAAEQIESIAIDLQEFNQEDIVVSKKTMQKMMGVGRLALLRYWLRGEPSYYISQCGKTAIISTIDFIYYGQAKELSASEIEYQAEGLVGQLEVWSTTNAKTAWRMHKITSNI